jgi:hypothetical protein
MRAPGQACLKHVKIEGCPLVEKDAAHPSIELTFTLRILNWQSIGSISASGRLIPAENRNVQMFWLRLGIPIKGGQDLLNKIASPVPNASVISMIFFMMIF